MDAIEVWVEEGCAVTCHKYKYDRSVELTRQSTVLWTDGQTNG